jgi:hypothetical protein
LAVRPDCRQAARKVTVVEARERVGERTEGLLLADGTPLELSWSLLTWTSCNSGRTVPLASSGIFANQLDHLPRADRAKPRARRGTGRASSGLR